MQVGIELDKPRNLRFDLRSIKDLEAAMGNRPLGSVLDDLSRMSMSALTIALLHGLKHEDVTLNMRRVDRMLEEYLEGGGTLDVVYGKVKDALDGSGLFRTKDDPVGNGTPEPATAG